MDLLIADNAEVLVESLGEFLKDKGHNVDLAFNGKQAMEFLDMHRYDIVFLDHDMPEMTGLELVRYIRSKGFEVKIVMMTGYPNVPDFFAKTLGADEYVGKPFTFDDILKVIEKFNGRG